MTSKILKKKQISVIERRLKSGEAFAGGSKAIPIRDPDMWTLRIVNSHISDVHIWEMQAEKGWVFLEPKDLAVKPEEIGFRVQDGRVVRGTQGAEVIMKMRRSDYVAIQAQKDQQNRDRTFGQKAARTTILRAADEEDRTGRGAELLERSINEIKIKDSVERVSLEE